MVTQRSQQDNQISSPRAQIFISYKRNTEPDEEIALQLFEALRQEHNVFIDQTMLVGTSWAEQIETELRRSQFLIVLLSEHSVCSEMVEAEISTARRLAKEQDGYPVILPVRLNYRAPFQYPLSAYLNRINWAFWSGSEDTQRLTEELMRAISGHNLSIDSDELRSEVLRSNENQLSPEPFPAAQPIVLELSQGTMDPESQFYVERQGDKVALSKIGEKGGVTLTIKGPGKSSLLSRVMNAAMNAGKQVVFLDFQLFDQGILLDANAFFQELCTVLTEELRLPNRLEEFWQSERSNNNVRYCTNYMQNYVLTECGGPLVLAMDEVDRILDTAFQSDFFGMLRNWHNNRALPLPMFRVWRKFDLALVTRTEPYDLIQNQNQSPFNIGATILLDDFTLEQVADLNQRHGAPLTIGQVKQLHELLHGHPYLIRQALYLVGSQHLEFGELLNQATQNQGPFGDHLRYHLFQIYDKKELVNGLLQVIQYQTCSDERIKRLLMAEGLIRSEGQMEMPRCQLYADYFGGHLR
jgi:AAA-like domain/TIR domain